MDGAGVEIDFVKNLISICVMYVAQLFANTYQLACWPNGKALDYGSRDCRFESCVGHSFLLFCFVASSATRYSD